MVKYNSSFICHGVPNLVQSNLELGCMQTQSSEMVCSKKSLAESISVFCIWGVTLTSNNNTHFNALV